MPDIDCNGKRLYELLRDGKFVLVTAAPVEIDSAGVVHAVGRHPELPDAVLVRPDGYVAWASERMPTPLNAAAVDHWCLWHSPGIAYRIGNAWPMTPMPAPRIGQIGQKYQAPAVRPTASQTVSTMRTIARYAARWICTPRRAALRRACGDAVDRCAESGPAVGQRRRRAVRPWCERRTWLAAESRTRPTRGSPVRVPGPADSRSSPARDRRLEQSMTLVLGRSSCLPILDLDSA